MPRTINLDRLITSEAFRWSSASLKAHGHYDVNEFEQHLMSEWGVYLVQMRLQLVPFLNVPECETTTAFYMEHCCGGEIPADFQQPLADLYGARFYCCEEYEALRASYWRKQALPT